MDFLKHNDTSIMLLDGDLNGKFIFDTNDPIGKGNFGKIFKGRNTYTFDEVAVKIEPVGDWKLHGENECYSILKAKQIDHNIPGLPEIYFFGSIGVKYYAMAMELLGPSLNDLFKHCGNIFSLKTVLTVAVQMLSRIEYVHSCELVHGDIKPENIVIGRPSQSFPYKESTENILYLINFGLSRLYVNPKTKKHIPYNNEADVVGTIEFMSTNAHSNIALSRRDDMESLGYMLLYLVNGTLPWLHSSEDQALVDETVMKNTITSKALCDGLPDEFVKYFDYVKQLGFSEKPKYEMLKTLFYIAYERINSPDEKLFDWSNDDGLFINN